MIKIKSTKLLFLYRSILFKFVKFQTEKQELQNIVEALNKKNKKALELSIAFLIFK